MAGNPRFEKSSSPDGLNFSSYCNGQPSHFRENLDGRFSTPGENFTRGCTSVPGERLPLSQVLLLDTLSTGDQKYSHYPELKRVINAAVGSVQDDPSLGPVQAKPLCSLPPEEVRRLRSCVTKTSFKARDRKKHMNEAISRLDKYRSPMLLRKRTRTDPSGPNPFLSVDRSASGGN